MLEPCRAKPDQMRQHIACAAVNGVDYLVSWNYKHIVNEMARRLTQCYFVKHQGFDLRLFARELDIIEVTQMRAKLDTGMDAVLEECYRMKA